MTDLKCGKCGATSTYADAAIADVRLTCGEGNDGTPNVIETAEGNVRHSWSGEEHDWKGV